MSKTGEEDAQNDYIERFHLRELVDQWVSIASTDRPSDPYQFLIAAAEEQRQTGGGIVMCPNPWCGMTMLSTFFAFHKRSCDNAENWIRCVRCNVRVEAGRMAQHKLHCRVERCPYCGEMVLPRMLNLCPFRLLYQAERDTRACTYRQSLLKRQASSKIAACAANQDGTAVTSAGASTQAKSIEVRSGAGASISMGASALDMPQLDCSGCDAEEERKDKHECDDMVDKDDDDDEDYGSSIRHPRLTPSRVAAVLQANTSPNTAGAPSFPSASSPTSMPHNFRLSLRNASISSRTHNAEFSMSSFAHASVATSSVLPEGGGSTAGSCKGHRHRRHHRHKASSNDDGATHQKTSHSVYEDDITGIKQETHKRIWRATKQLTTHRGGDEDEDGANSEYEDLGCEEQEKSSEEEDWGDDGDGAATGCSDVSGAMMAAIQQLTGEKRNIVSAASTTRGGLHCHHHDGEGEEMERNKGHSTSAAATTTATPFSFASRLSAADQKKLESLTAQQEAGISIAQKMWRRQQIFHRYRAAIFMYVWDFMEVSHETATSAGALPSCAAALDAVMEEMGPGVGLLPEDGEENGCGGSGGSAVGPISSNEGGNSNNNNTCKFDCTVTSRASLDDDSAAAIVARYSSSHHEPVHATETTTTGDDNNKGIGGDATAAVEALDKSIEEEEEEGMEKRTDKSNDAEQSASVWTDSAPNSHSNRCRTLAVDGFPAVFVRAVPNAKGAYLSAKDLESLRQRNATREVYPVETLLALIETATTILESRSVVQKLTIPSSGDFVVVGDIHGQMKDLTHVMQIMGPPSPCRYYLFNGDFIDRGPYGCEVIAYIFALLCAFPKYVFINRGNHEDYKTNTEYGFMAELFAKYGAEATRVHESLSKSYQAMPLMAIIDKRFCVVHGGVPREGSVSLSDIEAIGRVRDIPVAQQSTRQEKLLADLLWNDPVEKYRSRSLGPGHQGEGWRSSKRGCGAEYMATITRKFLRKNRLRMVIRSHETMLSGFNVIHSNQSVTVFSASNYGGICANRGAVAVLPKGAKRPVFHTWYLAKDPQLQGKRSSRSRGSGEHEDAEEETEEGFALDEDSLMMGDEFIRAFYGECLLDEYDVETQACEDSTLPVKDCADRSSSSSCSSSSSSNGSGASSCQDCIVAEGDATNNDHHTTKREEKKRSDRKSSSDDEQVRSSGALLLMDSPAHLSLPGRGRTSVARKDDEADDDGEDGEYDNDVEQQSPHRSGSQKKVSTSVALLSHSLDTTPEASQDAPKIKKRQQRDKVTQGRSYEAPMLDPNPVSPSTPHCQNSEDGTPITSSPGGTAAHLSEGYDGETLTAQERGKISPVQHKKSHSALHHRKQQQRQKLTLTSDASIMLQLRSLQCLRDMIYMNRYTLMSAFNLVDENQTGIVYKVEWCVVMRNVLKIDLPWYYLCQFFVPLLEVDGIPAVEYVHFLRHFEGPFARTYRPAWLRFTIQRIFCNVDLPEDVIRAFCPESSYTTHFTTAPAAPSSSTATTTTTTTTASTSPLMRLPRGRRGGEDNIATDDCDGDSLTTLASTTTASIANTAAQLFLSSDGLGAEVAGMAAKEFSTSNSSNNEHSPRCREEAGWGHSGATGSGITAASAAAAAKTTVASSLPRKLSNGTTTVNGSAAGCGSGLGIRRWQDVRIDFKTFASGVRALSHVAAAMEDDEIYSLFAFFDVQCSGSVSVGNFLDRVYDALPEESDCGSELAVLSMSGELDFSSVTSGARRGGDGIFAFELASLPPAFSSPTVPATPTAHVAHAPAALSSLSTSLTGDKMRQDCQDEKQQQRPAPVAGPFTTHLLALHGMENTSGLVAGVGNGEGSTSNIASIMVASVKGSSGDGEEEEEERVAVPAADSFATGILSAFSFPTQRFAAAAAAPGGGGGGGGGQALGTRWATIDASPVLAVCSGSESDSSSSDDDDGRENASVGSSPKLRLRRQRTMVMPASGRRRSSVSFIIEPHQAVATAVAAAAAGALRNDLSTSSVPSAAASSAAAAAVAISRSHFATPRMLLPTTHRTDLPWVYPALARLQARLLAGSSYTGLRYLFKALNRAGDGKLSEEEFTTLIVFMNQHLEHPITKAQAAVLFSCIREDSIAYERRLRLARAAAMAASIAGKGIDDTTVKVDVAKVAALDTKRLEDEQRAGKQFISQAEFITYFRVAAVPGIELDDVDGEGGEDGNDGDMIAHQQGCGESVFVWERSANNASQGIAVASVNRGSAPSRHVFTHPSRRSSVYGGGSRRVSLIYNQSGFTNWASGADTPQRNIAETITTATTTAAAALVGGGGGSPLADVSAMVSVEGGYPSSPTPVSSVEHVSVQHLMRVFGANATLRDVMISLAPAAGSAELGTLGVSAGGSGASAAAAASTVLSASFRSLTATPVAMTIPAPHTDSGSVQGTNINSSASAHGSAFGSFSTQRHHTYRLNRPVERRVTVIAGPSAFMEGDGGWASSTLTSAQHFVNSGVAFHSDADGSVNMTNPTLYLPTVISRFSSPATTVLEGGGGGGRATTRMVPEVSSTTHYARSRTSSWSIAGIEHLQGTGGAAATTTAPPAGRPGHSRRSSTQQGKHYRHSHQQHPLVHRSQKGISGSRRSSHMYSNASSPNDSKQTITVSNGSISMMAAGRTHQQVPMPPLLTSDTSASPRGIRCCGDGGDDGVQGLSVAASAAASITPTADQPSLIPQSQPASASASASTSFHEVAMEVASRSLEKGRPSQNNSSCSAGVTHSKHAKTNSERLSYEAPKPSPSAAETTCAGTSTVTHTVAAGASQRKVKTAKSTAFATKLAADDRSSFSHSRQSLEEAPRSTSPFLPLPASDRGSSAVTTATTISMTATTTTTTTTANLYNSKKDLEYQEQQPSSGARTRTSTQRQLRRRGSSSARHSSGAEAGGNRTAAGRLFTTSMPSASVTAKNGETNASLRRAYVPPLCDAAAKLSRNPSEDYPKPATTPSTLPAALPRKRMDVPPPCPPLVNTACRSTDLHSRHGGSPPLVSQLLASKGRSASGGSSTKKSPPTTTAKTALAAAVLPFPLRSASPATSGSSGNSVPEVSQRAALPLHTGPPRRSQSGRLLGGTKQQSTADSNGSRRAPTRAAPAAATTDTPGSIININSNKSKGESDHNGPSTTVTSTSTTAVSSSSPASFVATSSFSHHNHNEVTKEKDAHAPPPTGTNAMAPSSSVTPFVVPLPSIDSFSHR